MSHVYNVFPTTIYVGEVNDHKKHKEEFYKVYHKFDYEENKYDNTVSENISVPIKPLLNATAAIINENSLTWPNANAAFEDERFS